MYDGVSVVSAMAVMFLPSKTWDLCRVDLASARVLIRLDLNVPLSKDDGGPSGVSSFLSFVRRGERAERVVAV